MTMTMTMTESKDGAEAPVFHLEHEHDHAEGGSTLLGFWIYLMSDSLIFASLFATYAVLGGNYAGGPSPSQLFNLPIVAVNTAVMLVSSLTCGMAMLATGKGRIGPALGWLGVTGFLGLCFVNNQFTEYRHLAEIGATPATSAFLSSFFALIGTHALHVIVGLIWVSTLMVQVARHGLIEANQRRVICFSMFWNFLDITWVCVFTFVYLMGMLR
jgi:cytochrome o ubiquinol oxidase subunit III